MNCLPNSTNQPAGGPDQAVVSLVESETTFSSGESEEFTVKELVFEAELHRRAEVITDVLAHIMDDPATYRHWGLNE